MGISRRTPGAPILTGPLTSDGRASIPSPKRLALTLAVLLVPLLAIAFGSLYLNLRTLEGRAQELRQQVAGLQAEARQLAQAVEYLNTDAAVEEMARQELGWLKEGETGVIVVPKPSVPQAPIPFAPERTRSQVPNWQRWWDLFFSSRPAE